MTQLYVPRYDSLPRFTQFHRFFLKPHAGGAPLKSDHIQKLIIGKLGPAMSVPGQNPNTCLGTVCPIPPSADIVRDSSPLVKLRHSA
jgi:hypothetical protein